MFFFFFGGGGYALSQVVMKWGLLYTVRTLYSAYVVWSGDWNLDWNDL